MTIKYFPIPELDATGKIKTLFTTTNDIAWNFEDDNARENYIALGAQLGISPQDMVKTKQKHTDKIKIVTRQNGGDGILRALDENDPYDGLITNEKNLLLCTVEADCVPVYFYDPVKQVIAMVHSGWKGTVQKISEVAIQKMRGTFDCNPADIKAAIGPHICSDCYEVGQDVFDEFARVYGKDDMQKIFSRKNEEKYLLNLQEAVKFTLLKNGITEKNIFTTTTCTYHSQIQGHSLCSYRRTKSATQRMLTAIMMYE